MLTLGEGRTEHDDLSHDEKNVLLRYGKRLVRANTGCQR
jgi:hypothetical protein